MKGAPDSSGSGGAASRRIVVRGLPVAPGLAVGFAVFHDEPDVDVPVFALRPDDVEGEQARLAEAVKEARTQLHEVEERLEIQVGAQDARIFSVQGLLLEDPAFGDAIRERIASELINAEVAVRDAVASWGERLAGIAAGSERDPVADLRDVGRRLQRILAGHPRDQVDLTEVGGDQRAILVTRELLPSDTVTLDRSRLAGIITASGGVASHAAILARGLGIPAVTDVDVSSLPARGGCWIVDGGAGEVILDPTPDDVQRAIEKGETFQRVRDELMRDTRGYARTADKVAVELCLNVETFDDLPAELLEDLRGIGLFRTEFLFMERTYFPSEQEQYEHYVGALQRVGDREITFRTIDVGGDKPLSYLSVPHEPNPVLGWRGVRLSLQWPDMFYAQMRALLRASAHGTMRIMLPMITNVEEFERCREIMEEIQDDLRENGVPFNESVQLGAMVEVPAAALAARSLAERADFFSIGTNDLSQYALAVDRNNARVAALYQPFHPGVLQLIRMVIDAGRAADKPVSVCGEVAGDPRAVLLLLGLGLRAFSTSPFHLPAVRRLIARVTLEQAQDAAREVLELDRGAAIAAALHRLVLVYAPELEPFLAPVSDASAT
ncbi:MAG: phosphoenolpyruvate-protein phosphotransferase [Planctomycetota bacterium]|nr:MAG: phosphoenolpyruvate-protein phosphotransferase [Planctomycetota bacterium]